MSVKENIVYLYLTDDILKKIQELKVNEKLKIYKEDGKTIRCIVTKTSLPDPKTYELEIYDEINLHDFI